MFHCSTISLNSGQLTWLFIKLPNIAHLEMIHLSNMVLLNPHLAPLQSQYIHHYVPFHYHRSITIWLFNIAMENHNF